MASSAPSRSCRRSSCTAPSSAGAPAVAIVVTTYVVNMRHYLMAATLARAFRGYPRRWLALIAHVINDESFAVAVARSRRPDAKVYLGSAAAISGAFIAGVAVGVALGGLVERPERYGLDFASPAVFLALVAVQLRRRADWLVAIGAAVLAVALALVLPGNWHIVVAGLVVSVVAASVVPVDEADEER